MSAQIAERLISIVGSLVQVRAMGGYLLVHETLGRVVYSDQVVTDREQPPLEQAVCLLTLGDGHYICPTAALRWCVEGGEAPGEEVLRGAAKFAKIVEKWGLVKVVRLPDLNLEDDGLGPGDLGFTVIKFGENKKHLIKKFEFKTFFKKLKG